MPLTALSWCGNGTILEVIEKARLNRSRWKLTGMKKVSDLGLYTSSVAFLYTFLDSFIFLLKASKALEPTFTVLKKGQ